MVSLLKSLLRWLFAVAAILLGAGSILAAIETARADTAGGAPFDLSVCAYYAACLAIAVLYAVAWWTTGRPRTTRNGWAIAACLVNLAIAIFLLRYVRPFNFAFIAITAQLIALSIAGTVLFARRETAPPVARKRAKPARVPGDRTSPLFDGIPTVLAIGATWEAGTHWTKWATHHTLPEPSFLSSILIIVLACFAGIVLHECGHALAGAALQMKLLGFNAGPFQWLKREGRWKFKFNGSRVFGGSVSVARTNPNLPRWQEICMIAAGPAANFCTAPLFLLAALHAPGARWQPVWYFLSFATSLSVIVPACNLLPFRMITGCYSDGARILQLLTASPVVEYHQAMQRLQSTLVTPLRFRDLDPDTFVRVGGRYPTELTGLHLYLCAAGIFEDGGRIPEARAALAAAEDIYERFTIDLPIPLHTIFITVHACLNRDPAAARLWWDRMAAKKPKDLDFDYWLASAALNWIEGHRAGAEEAWQKANTRAQGLPHFGAYDFDRYRCALLRNELDMTAPEPTSNATVAQFASAL